MSRRRSLSVGTLVVLLVAGGVAWAGTQLDLDLDAAPASTTTATAPAAPTLAPPAAPAPTVAADYDRDAFGPRWADTDRNGCDQRNDVLARDLTTVTYKPGTRDCVVLTGVLEDAYTGLTIEFQRGETTSSDVQIDHVVPLSWAWQHGADAWGDDTRQSFANDLTNLQAVDGPTNASKSDQGPSTWMPPATAYGCTYAERFGGVVDAYGLTLDQADRAAIDQALTTCSP